MILEQYLQQYIGNSPVLFMLIGLGTLIVINLILSIVQAHQSKDDNINFELLPDFIKPLLMYATMLVAGEMMIIACKEFPLLYNAAKAFQLFAFLTILLKYFKQIYTKLKAMGMETTPELDRKIEDLTVTATTITPNQIKTTPINPADIVSSVITADKISVRGITSDQIVNGTVSTNTIVSGRPEEDNR